MLITTNRFVLIGVMKDTKVMEIAIIEEPFISCVILKVL